MSASASSDRHILLAEPDRSQSQMLATMLQLEGYATEEAFTLEEALTRVDSYPYDLVLTDLFVTRPPPRLEAAQLLQTPLPADTGWHPDRLAAHLRRGHPRGVCISAAKAL